MGILPMIEHGLEARATQLESDCLYPAYIGRNNVFSVFFNLLLQNPG